MLHAAKLLTWLCLGLMIFGGFKVTAWGRAIKIADLPAYSILLVAMVSVGWKMNAKWAKEYLQFVRGLLAAILRVDQSRKWLPASILLLLMLFGYFGAELARHWSIQTDMYDMSYTHASLFFPWRDGHLLHSPLSPLQSFLVDHFCPSLMIPGLVFRHVHSSVLVQLFQASLIVGGTALLVRFGPLQDRPRRAALAVVLIFCSRALFHSSVDFREDHLAFFFLCISLVGLHHANALTFFSGLLLYLGSKEHTPLLALGLIAPLATSARLSLQARYRWTLATLLLIVAYGALIYLWIIPALQAPVGQVVGQINMRLPHLGRSLPEIFLSPLLKPTIFWPWIFERFLSVSTLRYLALVLIPYAVFLKRAPIWVVAASLGILSNIIPERAEQRSIHWHYELAFAPFLVMGLLQGMRSMGRIRGWKWGVVVAIVLSLRWPAHGMMNFWPSLDSVRDSIALSRINCDEMILGANRKTIGQLAHCPQIRWGLPEDCADAGSTWNSIRSFAGNPQVPGETLKDATHLALDLTKTCDRNTFDWLLARGADLDWSSPSGRFRIVRGLARLKP